MESTARDVDLEMQSEPLLASPRSNNINSTTRQVLQTIILVVQSSLIFTGGFNGGAADGSSSTTTDSVPNNITNDTARMTETNVDCEIAVESQSVPLVMPMDHTHTQTRTPSLKDRMRTLVHVFHSTLIFKAAAQTQRPSSVSRVSSSVAAYAPIGGSDAIEKDPEVAEVHDSLTASSDYCLIIPQTSKNETTGIRLPRCQSLNISKIVREKNLTKLRDFGSIEGVVEALHTNLDQGILDDPEDISRRKLKAVAQSQIPALGFYHFLMKAFNNITILLLSVAAVLSFVFGIIEEGQKNGWFDGAVVLFTIMVLVLFTSIRNYWDERRARKKLEKQNLPKETEGDAFVMRGGIRQRISNSDLVDGDIAFLKKGYQVPADGLFIDGEGLELDDGTESGTIDEQNPFLFYGTRVINGNARMVVTSVDKNTAWSEMMSKATNYPDRISKLEDHLNQMMRCINIIGLLIAILILGVLFLRFKLGKMDEENGHRPEPKTESPAVSSFMNSLRKIFSESRFTARSLIKLLSVSLVGIIEGIPFVASLAITHWTDKTLSGKATEQDSLVCVKMASVTTICSDKFGGLTEHQMEVDTFFIGREFVSECSMLFSNVLEVLCDGIGTMGLIHHGAYNSIDETILSWAEDKMGLKMEIMKQSCTIFKHMGMNPFEEPCVALMGRPEDSTKGMWLHWNGPAMKILEMCTHYYDREGRKIPMDYQERIVLHKANKHMLNKQLKTIAFACKCTDNPTLEANDLILVGLLGLKNTSREDTRMAIAACRECGVKTILVSGDDVSVLQTIARQSGLITNDSESLILTGEKFRNFTNKEMAVKVEKICVIGNASPCDKLLLVQCLREKGEVVAMLGQRTNDAPALKEAGIGIAMGTWSSKKARESSDIIIWDGDFGYLKSMINCGKCIRGNIQKFFQPVLIMTIDSTLINLIGTISLGDAPLTTVQLLWVNLAMVFLGGLALLTGSPTSEPSSSYPVSRKEPLITMDMSKNIVIQVLYHVTCLLTLQHKGQTILGTTSQKAVKSMIFNSFFLCQFFNLFNARELEKKNFFKGFDQNNWFGVALAALIVLQGIFVMIQPIVDSDTNWNWNWKVWTGPFLVGVVSCLIDWVGKYTSQFIKSKCSHLDAKSTGSPPSPS